MYLRHPRKGKMSVDEVIVEVAAFMAAEPDAEYELVIGADSHTRVETKFVTVLVVRRVGKGATYFYTDESYKKISSLRHRIYQEMNSGLQLAHLISSKLDDLLEILLAKNLYINFSFGTIQMDVGDRGATKELLKEVVNLVSSHGFDCETKADSMFATKAADKHSK